MKNYENNYAIYNKLENEEIKCKYLKWCDIKIK